MFLIKNTISCVLICDHAIRKIYNAIDLTYVLTKSKMRCRLENCGLTKAHIA